MLDMRIPIRFFIGVNSSGGFTGFTDDLYEIEEGWKAFLIKGGPGSGKSELLKRVYRHVTAYGQEAYAFICALNPNSFDGLVFPDIKVCVLDANAPHVIEPKCWGAVEQIVNLSTCINPTFIRERRAEIIEANRTYNILDKRYRKFIGAAANLLGDSRRIAFECTDTTKIQRNAARIAAREFGPRSELQGKESRRFISAVTSEGLMTFQETIQSMCPRIYSVEDEQGVSSRLLIDELRKRALDNGHDVISCYCPLFPKEKPEHLLIPEIGIGFTTSNLWHKADFPVYRRIHAARFTDSERLRQRRQLMSFNRRAARELINEAVIISGEAKAIMDDIKKIYDKYLDKEGLQMMADWVISEMDEVLISYA
ncbi:MAG: hypothetical protein PHH84_05085 [Oscillospiraceae bacterium]|nr:hypothetical protein [Oscillospiraceae bacterium]MDD4414549.1 hypothetical protein [Oscillospiraceae bacterium]